MSYGVVNGVSRGGCIGRVVNVDGERQFWGKLGHPVVTDGDFAVRGGDAAFPKLLCDFLLSVKRADITAGRVLTQQQCAAAVTCVGCVCVQ